MGLGKGFNLGKNLTQSSDCIQTLDLKGNTLDLNNRKITVNGLLIIMNGTISNGEIDGSGAVVLHDVTKNGVTISNEITEFPTEVKVVQADPNGEEEIYPHEKFSIGFDNRIKIIDQNGISLITEDGRMLK